MASMRKLKVEDEPRLHVRLNPEDKLRLDFIRSVYGISLTAAVRVCIRAASERLGMEKPKADIL